MISTASAMSERGSERRLVMGGTFPDRHDGTGSLEKGRTPGSGKVSCRFRGMPTTVLSLGRSAPISSRRRPRESPGSRVDALPGLPTLVRAVAFVGDRSPITVAGPRRIHTGFLVPPSPTSGIVSYAHPARLPLVCIDENGRKGYVPVDFTVVQGKSGEKPVRTRHCIRDVDPGSQVAWPP